MICRVTAKMNENMALPFIVKIITMLTDSLLFYFLCLVRSDTQRSFVLSKNQNKGWQGGNKGNRT